MGKKKIFFIILMILILMPVKTYALSIDNFIYILEDCSGILGDPINDTSSVAWLVNKILDILKIVGPLIAIVISSFDFAMVIVNGDDEGMAKAKKKLFSRLVLVAALFFIPVLTKVILSILGVTGNAVCGII